MQNNSRNLRINGRKTVYRKTNRLKRLLILIVTAEILLLMLLGIRDIKSQLKEMQKMLERIEVLQYSKNDIWTAPESWEQKTRQGQDYVSSVGLESVDRPVKRTAQEMDQRLKELGKEDPVIEEISKNTSLYPESMLMALANNPEMADFVAGYLHNGGVVTGSLTEAEKTQDFPLLLQWDPRWGYHSYGDSCIGVAGCGPTCLSMVMLHLTGKEILTPDVIADYAMENDYYVSGTGTAWALIDSFPVRYGIKVTEPKITEKSVKAELDKGKILICAMDQGDFTAGGHFIVVYGYDEEGLLVNDPNCVARSRKKWNFESIKNQIKMIWAYGT